MRMLLSICILLPPKYCYWAQTYMRRDHHIEVPMRANRLPQHRSIHNRTSLYNKQWLDMQRDLFAQRYDHFQLYILHIYTFLSIGYIQFLPARET